MEHYKNLDLENIGYIDDYGISQIEEWKDIHNYKELYQVSDLGRVKRLSYVRFMDVNNSYSIYKEKILKQSIQKSKYLGVSLSKNNKKKTYSIHQLIAKSFLNHNYSKNIGLVVDHIDNNRLNNKLNNLQIITHRKNSSKDRKGSSTYTGVFFRKDCNKWCSSIVISDKGQIKLGNFINEEDAGRTYQIALQNITKYNGNNKDFRELIRNLL